jgi:hypothetical protein
LHLISAQRDSRESGAESIADDVARTRLVEGQGDHVLSALGAATVVWVGRQEGVVRAANGLLKNILHPGYPANAASGKARASRTTAPVNVEPVVPVRRTER